MQLTSMKTICEMTATRPRVSRISIETLRARALQDARRRGKREDHIMVSPLQAFIEWMNLASVRPYFSVGNPIGLDTRGARGVKHAYFLAYTNAQILLAERPI